ncbi:hypothetical protein AWC29_11935 [Mycobacterium triplex]|uniref:Uncharacterized protein n=1 Tax=Mycobacterium triplex TaxID=47839 RepID=A0A024K063_9MYCO|nr:hypothetical protein AWC29_11935 [Mycobacterium triplex]CDO89184.1 hypothetical protein BN973_03556 [Mycobacterium triplex]
MRQRHRRLRSSRGLFWWKFGAVDQTHGRIVLVHRLEHMVLENLIVDGRLKYLADVQALSLRELARRKTSSF